jgi:hypothetical protein
MSLFKPHEKELQRRQQFFIYRDGKTSFTIKQIQ